MLRISRPLCLSIFSALLFGLVCTGHAATTITVPAQQPTIQSAIDAASSGDTVAVAPGSYNEDLNFKGKAIALVGTGGATQTFLTGAGGPYVLTFQNGEDRSTSVRGFTLRIPPGVLSQIVFASESSPTLTENVFEPNAGCAILGGNSSLLLQRNVLRNAECRTGPFYGVVSFDNNSSPSIKDNAFQNNKGSALYIELPTNNAPDIANNTIVGNDIGIRIAAYVDQHTILLRNNLISGNGIGVSIDNLAQPAYAPFLQNNLVNGNTSNYQGLADPTGLNGNISASPKLGGLNIGDFHPDPGSPAIDAGTAAAVDAQATDLYGKQRVRSALSGTPIPDIGAAEYVGVPPTASLSTSSTTVALGASITLTWTSSGASNCSASGAWNGSLALNGTATITPTAGAAVYGIICSNSAAARGQSLTLSAVPPPTVLVSADATSILEIDQDTIRWSSSNASSCTKSGAWRGAAPTGGSQVLQLSAGSYTFTITCAGIGGSAAASLTITVKPIPKITLGLSQSVVPFGGTTVLTWSVSDATSCIGSGGWTGPKPLTGALIISATVIDIYSYSLTCTGSGYTTTSTAIYQVYGPSAPYSSSSLAADASAVIRGFAYPGNSTPISGGLDGHGYTYDAEYIGGAVQWAGQQFLLGSSSAGWANVTIPLPSMQLAGITFVATGVLGNQLDQSFVVTYTDGTTTTYTQSLSDWGSPQHFPGEQIVRSAGFRVTPAGALQGGSWSLYGYHLILDPSKIVQSLGLPKTRKVIVLALNVNPPPQQYVPYLGNQFNITAIATPGSPATSGGFDGHGYAYDGSALPADLPLTGFDFNLGPATFPSGVSKSTISLTNRCLSITVLAAAVNGSQLNQSFVANYSGGGTTVFTQSISDWGSAQGYVGESTALTLPYRITPSGAKQAGKWKIYSYTFTLDASLSLTGLTLPNNRNVIILGIGQTIVN